MIEVNHVVQGWMTSSPRKGDGRIALYVYDQTPTTQIHSMPVAICGSGRSRNRFDSFEAVLHAKGAEVRLKCLPGRWKPDMLLPRIAGMRGSIPYGHTATAMHDIRYSKPCSNVTLTPYL